MVEASQARIELFRFYVEQTRFTEAHWLQVARFFSTLLTAIVAASFVLIRSVAPERVITILIVMSLVGLVVASLASALVWDYQLLLKSWVVKRQALEGCLFQSEDPALRAIWTDTVEPMRKKRLFMLRFSVWLFVTFAALFLVTIGFCLLAPDAVSALLPAKPAV